MAISRKLDFTKVKKGDRRQLSRTLTAIFENDPAAIEILEQLNQLPLPKNSIGITGPPGAGKSTFINQLVKVQRQTGTSIAVVAFDPTSPYSGGAILGDRIRMNEHGVDPGVFIRSFGTRDNPNGLPVTLPYMLQLFHAAGFDAVIIETVGSGQLDVLIKQYADTTILLLTPESGDEIQVMKAGILEIADLFVINKDDRPGVERMQAQLQTWVSLLPHEVLWRPPVLTTQASTGKGTPQVQQAIIQHREFSVQHPQYQQQRLIDQAINFATVAFRNWCREQIKSGPLKDELQQQKADLRGLASWLTKKYQKETVK